MRPFAKRFLYLLLPALAAAAWAANTEISPNRPVINFSLPTFTPDGHRSWLVRGSEAVFSNRNQIDVKGLTLSVFSGKEDGKIETVILSPAARVVPAEALATGAGTIRVINDEFEAQGADWQYAHKEKRVSIAKDVRVVFNTELKDFLK